MNTPTIHVVTGSLRLLGQADRSAVARSRMHRSHADQLAAARLRAGGSGIRLAVPLRPARAARRVASRRLDALQHLLGPIQSPHVHVRRRDPQLANFVRSARRAGVERIVHVSITNPSLDSPFEYFRGKAEVEGALRQSGVSYAILRPAVLFGEEDILINNIVWMLRRLPVIGVFGKGDYRLQPILVGDLAALAIDEAFDARTWSSTPSDQRHLPPRACRRAWPDHRQAAADRFRAAAARLSGQPSSRQDCGRRSCHAQRNRRADGRFALCRCAASGNHQADNLGCGKCRSSRPALRQRTRARRTRQRPKQR